MKIQVRQQSKQLMLKGIKTAEITQDSKTKILTGTEVKLFTFEPEGEKVFATAKISHVSNIELNRKTLRAAQDGEQLSKKLFDKLATNTGFKSRKHLWNSFPDEFTGRVVYFSQVKPYTEAEETEPVKTTPKKAGVKTANKLKK